MNKIRLNRLEFRRKLFHLIFGLSLLIGIYSRFLGLRELVGLLALGVVLSILCRHHRIPLISRLIDAFERPEYVKTMPGRGALYEVTGVLLSVALFPRDIALASTAIMAIGDSIAPLIGQFGKVKHFFNSRKMIEGTIAAIICSAWGASFFVAPVEALCASTVSMAAEVFEIRLRKRIIDDNISVPLLSGAVIVIIRALR